MNNYLKFGILGLILLMSCSDKKAPNDGVDAITAEEKQEIIKIENLTNELDSTTNEMEMTAKKLEEALMELDK